MLVGRLPTPPMVACPLPTLKPGPGSPDTGSCHSPSSAPYPTPYPYRTRKASSYVGEPRAGVGFMGP